MNPLQTFLNWLSKQWLFLLGGFLSGIIAFIWQVISNPVGAINQFMIHVINIILPLWPSTPSNLRVGSLIDNFGSSFPLIGSGIIAEIFNTLLGALSIFILIKLYKLLPFV